MNKKSTVFRIIIFLVLLAITIPAFLQRAVNENKNNDVIFALNYNNAAMVLSEDELRESIEENKEIGVNSVIIAEESINSLINGGLVSAIKYNVLCHKYDDESEEIIKNLSGNTKIHNDSYVLITKRDEWKKLLEKWITAKYSKDEYVKTTSPQNADVYVIYESVSEAWHRAICFDEAKLENAKKSGMNIVLSLMLDAYTNTDYIDEIGKLIDKYDVKFINLKKTHKDKNAEKSAKKNYNAFCKLIEEKELCLILTEEQTQLSNQKPIGYNELIESAEGRVLRSYETADFETTNTGATISDKRYHQMLNSVVDRNIRFVAVNQLTNGTDTMAEKSEKTNAATKATIEKLNSIGFVTDNYDTVYDYKVNRPLTSAAAMLVMILMGLWILEWLAEKKLVKIRIIAIIGAVLSVPFTFLAPEGIVLLYPSLFALIAPCFAITAVMMFVKYNLERLSCIKLILSATALSVAVMMYCATIQAALLSGLDYYLNSIIFRGIKISLFVPILYSAVIYAIIFARKDEKLITRAVNMLNANIKVYWVILAGIVGGAAVIYLVRSGNVESISGIENYMRNAITNIMHARPRTKEFLFGWPCFIMMLYYMKNTKCTVLQWCFTVGGSILFASVMNSFCHVFTSVGVIYMRVLNGLLIGLVISVGAVIVNHIIVCAVKKYLIEGKKNG